MIQFAELHDSSSRAFEEAMDIYMESIPAAERQSIETLKERLGSGRERLFVGYVEGRVALMALLYPLKQTQYVLLDYFAVKKQYRNMGIGSQFIANIFKLTNMGDKRFILEVEDPTTGGDASAKISRINFYRRNGAKELKAVPYFLPPLQGSSPTKMVLFLLAQHSVSKLSGLEVRGLLVQVYGELYGRAAVDPLLVSFVTLVPAEVIVE